MREGKREAEAEAEIAYSAVKNSKGGEDSIQIRPKDLSLFHFTATATQPNPLPVSISLVAS